MDPTDFLLARIAEDEQAVSAWGGAVLNPKVRPAVRRTIHQVVGKYGLVGPARMTAESEARRRIVEGLRWGGPDHYDEWHSTLQILALPYADHPDYRQEWRP